MSCATLPDANVVRSGRKSTAPKSGDEKKTRGRVVGEEQQSPVSSNSNSAWGGRPRKAHFPAVLG